MKLEDYRPGLLRRLKDPDFAVNYLTAVLSDESPSAFFIALKDVIDARNENVSAVARSAGLTRQGLYRALSKGGNPALATVDEILKALDLRLVVSRRT